MRAKISITTIMTALIGGTGAMGHSWEDLDSALQNNLVTEMHMDEGTTIVEANMVVNQNRPSLTVFGNGAVIDGDERFGGFSLNNLKIMELHDITFQNFYKATGHGGVINSLGNDVIIGDNVSFIGNILGGNNNHGAAIRMEGGNLAIGNNALFEGNETSGTIPGGAVYCNGCNITITTEEDGVTRFNNYGADIVLAGSASRPGVININGDGGTTAIEKGIKSETTAPMTTFINKSGEGKLVLGKDSDNSGFVGTFNQTGGTTEARGKFFGGVNNVSGGTLRFTSSNHARSITLSGTGVIDIRSELTDEFGAPGEFNTLSVVNWTGTGSGLLRMNAYIDNGYSEADRLQISGGAAVGDTTILLSIFGNGTPSSGLMLVEARNASTNEGTFSLPGGSVDIGAFEYRLVKSPIGDWYLGTGEDPTLIDNPEYDEPSAPGPRAPTLSNPARTTGAVPAMHLAVVKTGMNELRKRLGDLRGSGGQKRDIGAWARSYVHNVSFEDNIAVDKIVYGGETGFDFEKRTDESRIFFGIMGGMMRADNIKIRQSNSFDGSGVANAPSVGLYGTWLHKSGWFVDATARNFWVETNLKNITAAGDMHDQKSNRDFVSGSIETGRQFMLNQSDNGRQIAIEPRVEARYTFAPAGEDYETSMGHKFSFDDTRSLDTRLSLQVSYLPNGAESTWKPFAEIAVYNEWMGRTNITFAGVDLQSDIGGMGAELALGTNVKINDSAYMYADIAAEYGEVFKSYSANVGARMQF